MVVKPKPGIVAASPMADGFEEHKCIPDFLANDRLPYSNTFRFLASDQYSLFWLEACHCSSDAPLPPTCSLKDVV
jgi:hypothetical protein